MNCNEVRKYLYAFADGELETPENLDVLEHLNMCPGCTQKINVQQRLRENIARVMSEVTAPPELRAAVITLLRTQVDDSSSESNAPASTDTFPSPRLESEPDGRPRERTAQHDDVTEGNHHEGAHVHLGMRRYWISGALAAALLLAVVGMWPKSSPNSPAIDSPIQLISYTDTSESGRALAELIYQEHLKGCDNPAHHHAGIAHNLDEAAAQLSERMDGCPMLRCDRLVGDDVEFASANICTLVDSDNRPVDAGHIVLKRDAQYISLISVFHLQAMKDLKTRKIGKREYVLLCPKSASEDAPVTVVGFDCPKASHFVCAPYTPEEAVQLADPMSFAAMAVEAPAVDRPYVFASHSAAGN